MSERKKRRCYSVKKELIAKSREAMLAAVQIYNNPNITFKAEIFITLSVISWTYLLHAYYRDKKIDYRYYKPKDKAKRYEKTKGGSYKYWELEKCLNDVGCPVDEETKANLRFLIEIRHEVEHKMTDRIDECLIPKLQACAINFDYYIGKLFEDKYRLNKSLAFAIQLAPFSPEQQGNLLTKNNPHITSRINNFIADFESGLPDNIKASDRYAYRLLFRKASAKREGQADQVLDFIPSNSPLAEGMEKHNVSFVAVEKPTDILKYKPKKIVDIMKKGGYPKFNIQRHTELWKQMNAKGDSRYGAYAFVGEGGGQGWGWYPNWIDVVRRFCQEHSDELQ